jgi:hypothetical protein
MKDQILKIAKVKSEKDFYKKYPTEEAFMKAHGKELKKAAMGKSMVNKQLHQLTDFGNPPIAQGGGNFNKYLQGTTQFGMNPDGSMKQVGDAFNNASMAQMSGQQMASNMSSQFATPSSDKLLGVNDINKGAAKAGGFDAMGAGMAALGALPGIIGGVEAIGAQKKAKKKAEQASQLSGLALQAQQTTEKAKRKYVRPEDMILQPGQMGNPYGSGTNFLAKNGKMIGGNPTEIQNIYNPGDIYTDAGYEPIESQKLKQYRRGGNLPEAEFGDYFQDSGQAQIGSAVGQAAGNLIGGPLGGMIGGLLGKVGGNLLGGAKDARELQAEKDRAAMNTQQAAFAQAQQNQFGAYMEQGGKVDVGDEYKWVSHTWQPQTIAKFGEYNVKDLLKPPHDADMLRSGGHLKDEYYTPPSAAAMFTGRPELKPLTMEHGGKFAMGGDLEVIEGGKAETISYNPFLPDGGETVMFKGRSHDNGGIPINFGDNGVEVEGGEPAVKLRDGGNESNMVVFGNMKLSNMAADEFGIPDAKGKKFKHVAEEISKVEKKQNKLIDKATERADMTTGNSGFDQLKMNTSEAQLIGANMKLRSAAILKQNLAAVQNAILDTASELGVKSDELAQGKLVKEKDPRMMAKYGTKLKKAQAGDQLSDYDESEELSTADLEMMKRGMSKPGFMGVGAINLPEVTVTGNRNKSKRLPAGIEPLIRAGLPLYEPLAPQLFTGQMPDAEMAFQQAQAQGEDISEVGGERERKSINWKTLENLGNTALSNLAPWLRPRTNIGLDPEELYPEYFAMATNQLEPVQAQTFQPMLDTPMDISLNDQLNAIDSQSRAAIRAAGQNPSAQAMIMAQTLEAKNKVLGEQTRINATNKMQTYDKNRAMLNEAQLRNLQILDQQYFRQAQARSNTKAQTLEALKSIAAKTAQNKLENQTLNVYENMYNYRFSPSGRAFNVNAPAQFNVPENIGVNDLTGAHIDKIKELYEKVVSRDKTGAITGSKEKTRTTKQNRNGAIVQALKNL